MGDTLTAYYGEFLINPAPLELSGNWCSHSCFYCFANLNNPNRTIDIKQTLATLRNFPKNKNLVAELLKRKYPTIVSNHVDPFAKSNYKQMVPIMRFMTELGLPIVLQTKGGYGIDEALEFLLPSVWYISISHNDDSTRRKIEPGAPTIESRLALCDRLIKAGHKVTVGINPCVEDWLPEPEQLTATLAELGVWGCWVEVLHFNYKQLRKMHPKHKEAFGDELIAGAQKRKAPEATVNHYLRTRQAVTDAGMHLYSIGQCGYSDFFEWGDCYEHLYPTLQGFTNHVINSIQAVPEPLQEYEWEPHTRFITYADWRDYFLPRLPDIGKHSGIRSYITSQNQEWNLPFKVIAKPSFGHIFYAAWKCDKIKMGSFYTNAGVAQIRKDNKIVLCEDGFPVLHFDPTGNYDYINLE